MTPKEPEELDEWMHLWQSNVRWSAPLREDFERRTQRANWSFYLSMVAMMGILIVLIWRMFFLESLFHLLFMGAGGCLLIGAMVQVCLTHFKKQISTPLTPREYLDKCRHNLTLERRNVQWGKRLWPVSLMFLAISLVLLYRQAPFERFIMLVMGLAAPGYMMTWYVTFVYGPEQLQKEARRLHELERSWSGDDVDGIV